MQGVSVTFKSYRVTFRSIVPEIGLRKNKEKPLVSEVMPVAARPLSGSSVHQSVQIRYHILQGRASRPCRQHRQVLRVQAAKKADGPSVAIVGVTGAVGQEFLRVSSALEYYSNVSASL